MKIFWDWSLESETDRLLHAASNIANGFYSLQGFYPLPWDDSIKYNAKGVYLPILPYSSIPHFWSHSAKLDNRILPLQAPALLFGQTKELLASTKLVKPDYQNLAALTEKILPKVNEFLVKLIPSLKLPMEIKIYPTYFGTFGSFNWMDSCEQIVIYLRHDQGIRSLIECYLTSLLRPQASNDLSATWNETEFLVDWLIHTTTLNQFIPVDPTWSGTLKLIRSNNNQRISQLSQNFLQKIGAPTSSNHAFSQRDGQIYFNDNCLENLTARETTVMAKLIELAPNPVNLDQLADIIFTVDEKYSLAAINKAIERLRTKLEAMGISRHYLATASGVGYYLKN